MKKIENIKVLSSYEATLMQMPYINSHNVGSGIHKSAKYPNRQERKKEAKKIIKEETSWS